MLSQQHLCKKLPKSADVCLSYIVQHQFCFFETHCTGAGQSYEMKLKRLKEGNEGEEQLLKVRVVNNLRSLTSSTLCSNVPLYCTTVPNINKQL